MAEDGMDDFDSIDDLDDIGGDGEGGGDIGDIEGGHGDRESRDLDLILDIPLTVTVELGRCKMLINDLLQLGQGSVVELTKLVGEPLEVLVNQKLVARGEVVVVNEKFGVRLTDIISPMERVQSLG
ncbi:MAG: flagellar motor switch protein FliN [Candidatus Nitrohelix vancouverensis]|uniref:Flagellar motor switch protein FliN n=1 Tax=Candidatus Nitrohelix vancouverensis TaxID=2705534 RepID=A0A7T0C2N0_9BACT|nr:MAG: flagellar motor switch protein FliN [Candidatus Nitrohelix vancouverensis]